MTQRPIDPKQTAVQGEIPASLHTEAASLVNTSVSNIAASPETVSSIPTGTGERPKKWLDNPALKAQPKSVREAPIPELNFHSFAGKNFETRENYKGLVAARVPKNIDPFAVLLALKEKAPNRHAEIGSGTRPTNLDFQIISLIPPGAPANQIETVIALSYRDKDGQLTPLDFKEDGSYVNYPVVSNMGEGLVSAGLQKFYRERDPEKQDIRDSKQAAITFANNAFIRVKFNSPSTLER